MRQLLRPWIVGSLVMLAGVPEHLRAQGLELRLITGKMEYFEEEPVYLLVEITNTSSTSLLIPEPDLASDAIRIVVFRSDGSLVPEIQLWVDYTMSPQYRPIQMAAW